jgi:hypothetical protein
MAQAPVRTNPQTTPKVGPRVNPDPYPFRRMCPGQTDTATRSV